MELFITKVENGWIVKDANSPRIWIAYSLSSLIEGIVEKEEALRTPLAEAIRASKPEASERLEDSR